MLARVGRDWHGERRLKAGLVSQPIDFVVHGAEVELVARDDPGDGALERVDADAIEQRSRPEVAAPTLAPRSASRSIMARADGTAAKSRSKPRL